MDLIAESNNAIEFLTDENSIISGKVRLVSIYLQENRLFLDIQISLMYSKQFDTMLIRLEDVIEYSFYYNSNSNFYYIEEFKLFKADQYTYLSLDPFDSSSKEIDEKDNDFAIAKEIKIYADMSR